MECTCNHFLFGNCKQDYDCDCRHADAEAPYRIILNEELDAEVDTDYGVLRAFFAAGKRLALAGNRKEFLKFLRYTERVWGEYKAEQIRGEAIDTGLLKGVN